MQLYRNWYPVQDRHPQQDSPELYLFGGICKNTQDVLWDTFHTSVLIGTRGSTSAKEFEELTNGFKKMSSFIFSGSFTIDTAILCASKAAYLSALILQGIDLPDRFDKGLDLSDWSILNTEYNKLNKVKKTSPEAFFYLFQALRVLEILE